AVETLLFRARRALREQLEGASGCDEAHALIAAESLGDDDRRRLRAHTRTCRACATLERRRRGRLAAARRKLAGLLPAPSLPSWLSSLLGGGGAKAVAVVATAAVAATGAVESTRSARAPRPPADRAPSVVDVAPAAPSVAATRPAIRV